MGESLSNYIGDFCSDVFLGIMQVWWYLEKHSIGDGMYISVTNGTRYCSR
jgi:hypothetical protein